MGNCFSFFECFDEEDDEESIIPYSSHIVNNILENYPNHVFMLTEYNRSVMFCMAKYAFSKTDYTMDQAIDYIKKYRMDRSGKEIHKLYLEKLQDKITEVEYLKRLDALIKQTDPQFLTFIPAENKEINNSKGQTLVNNYNKNWLQYN